MKLSDLDFTYPESLIGLQPSGNPRVMWVENKIPTEIQIADLIQKIPAGDVLVLNDTKVLKRRVFAEDLEILFLHRKNQTEWEVLFPSKKYKVGDVFQLPLGVRMKLTQKGRPQTIELSENISEDYFEKVGELPLPPYIQKARDQRHTVQQDQDWYQTAWAQKSGSLASPTASLHFKKEDLQKLKNKGVRIVSTTLHVGLGTFLPVVVDDLNDHFMHAETSEISRQTWTVIQDAKSKGHKIWSLGTTTTRSLESAALGLLSSSAEKSTAQSAEQSDAPLEDILFKGETKLLIQPGFQFQVVDRLLTNFHQPQSTLLALVAAFEDLQTVKKCYEWAIQKEFKLFSYGDLSVWIK